MTQSLLGPTYYIDSEIFAQEQTALFRKLWIFAGLRTLLSEPDAFLTRTVGGIPVLVQNFAGQIKAFENQCVHRQMPLQFEDYGQRRLACRYHGWVYDANGCARSIPGEQTLYRYTEAESKQLCLREFAVEVIGNLIFVNLDPEPLPIATQFSDELRIQLAEASGHIGSQAIHAHIPGCYNWKLNFENVLDSNHVPYVHPKSFQPLIKTSLVKPQLPPSEIVEVDAIDSATLASLSYMSRSPFKSQPQHWHSSVPAYGDGETYINFFLYPNVNFVSPGGRVFLVQQFDPIAADQTNVIFTLTVAREKNRIHAMPAILWGHMKGEKRVLDEDRVLLEALQSALHKDGKKAMHGAYEAQLQRVASVYLRLMAPAIVNAL